MWPFTMLFGEFPASRRRVCRTLFGHLESIEPRRLLSVAMPGAEIHRAPPHPDFAAVTVSSSAPERAPLASNTFLIPGIGGSTAGTVAMVASDDEAADPGQNGGDIPPVIGKVSW